MACAMVENAGGGDTVLMCQAVLAHYEDQARWLEQQPLLRNAGALRPPLVWTCTVSAWNVRQGGLAAAEQAVHGDAEQHGRTCGISHALPHMKNPSAGIPLSCIFSVLPLSRTMT